jgi:hypothetical protein
MITEVSFHPPQVADSSKQAVSDAFPFGTVQRTRVNGSELGGLDK